MSSFLWTKNQDLKFGKMATVKNPFQNASHPEIFHNCFQKYRHSLKLQKESELIVYLKPVDNKLEVGHGFVILY